MSDIKTSDEILQSSLAPILSLLEKQKLVESLVRRQQSPKQDLLNSLVGRQQSNELRHELAKLHAADIAHLLEMLPLDDRLLVWGQVPIPLGGGVLWDVPDTIAGQLIEATERSTLIAMCKYMQADEVSQIVQYMPEAVMQEILASMQADERQWLQSSITYPEDSVGHLMSSDIVAVHIDMKIKDVLKQLQQRGDVPDHTDKVFVVDERQKLLGVLSLTQIFFHKLNESVRVALQTKVVTFRADDNAQSVAQAFERYDLISAPVLDGKGKLIGRLTVDVVMDFVREAAEDDLLRREGLNRHVDLFTPVWNSAKERWLWLSINLVTAFLASRVIGLFEGSIEKLVALATLMPIVASIGGNTGNQTVALFIRGLALGHVSTKNVRYLALKEVAVAAVNGIIWGSTIGVATFLLYQDKALGGVIALATLLNLLVAAIVGIVVPLGMHRIGRDPALGSSVLLTFSTDSMGFFIFLGLASVLLI